QVILLDQASDSFKLTGLTSKPVVSVLRDFSAPVRLRMERSDEELAFLMAHDSDAFNRWDAGQTLATKLLLDLAGDVGDGNPLVMSTSFSDAFGRLLADDSLDGSFKALALTLPQASVLGQEMAVIDPDALHAAREFFRENLAKTHSDALYKSYQELSSDGPYKNDQRSINRRRLKNVLLGYLSALQTDRSDAIVAAQFDTADNMTDQQAALSLLANSQSPDRQRALQSFYDQYHHDPLVLDKWFSVQAISRRPDAIEQVVQLTEHPDFTIDNPNRVRSLLGAFTQNQLRFHQADGAGYRLLADFVLQIESANPQLAARLVAALNSYRRFDPGRQEQMESQLQRIAAHDGLCKDVYEIVQRALSFQATS
ncbi:MAG: DUF3458 domain-containing protein, partial [Pirellulaceae bacterium]|nr:DUF3458 domain-containing protein [Pirellulaceae bacterium]